MRKECKDSLNYCRSIHWSDTPEENPTVSIKNFKESFLPLTTCNSDYTSLDIILKYISDIVGYMCVYI